MMHDVRLVVFDWDGTLMDSVARIVACMRAAITELHVQPRTDEQIRQIIGLGLQEALSTLYPELHTSMHAQLADRYRYHYMVVDTTPSALFPGIEPMLIQLKQSGCYLAIATGKSRAGLNQVLQQTNVADLFDITRCADETRSKPDPRMLHEIMAELAISVDYSLMVGDSEYDLLMAKRAGMPALAVSYGVHPQEQLMIHQPVHCVTSSFELHDWMRAHLISGLKPKQMSGR